MQPGERFPAISELGMFMPGRFYYQLGFGTTGLLLAYQMLQFPAVFTPLFPEDATPLIKACSQSGFFAAIGATIQGVFTMENAISNRSLIHWAGAFVFAFQTMKHSQLIQKLFEDYDCPFVESAETLHNLRKHLLTSGLQTIMFIAFGSMIMSQMFNAGQTENTQETEKKKKGDKKEGEDGAANQQPEATPGQIAQKNAMGLMQWGVIGLQAFAFATYCGDFYIGARMEPYVAADVIEEVVESAMS